jgi:hypothetical protein
MPKQIKVTINNKKPTVIDVVADESISVIFDNPPTMVWKGKKLNKRPRLKVNGLRWRDGSHFQMEWLNQALKLNDKITIEITKTSKSATVPKSDKQYIAPERTCSFCHKKESEVGYLVDGGIMARICDACVKLCQKAIDERAS